jgi:WD40 repeat protein
MTMNEGFDVRLAEWLHESSEHRVPGHLDEVLLRTAATSQRRWWSSPERWLPMQATERFAPALPRLSWLVLVLLLALALFAAAILVGVGRPRLPNPFGLARNGDFVFSTEGDIYRFDPTSGSQTPLITGPTWDFGPFFARDGSRMTFGRLPRDPSAVSPDVDLGMILMIANADGTNVRELTPPVSGACWSDWSPDGQHYVFRMERPDGQGVLNVVDVDTGTIRTIDPGISVRCGPIAYRPPTGAEIVFRGDASNDHGVFAIRPDGSGLRRVNTEHPVCDCDTGVVSPDGRYMAIDRWDVSRVVRLWLLDLDVGSERQLPMPAGHFARGGAFSPDGAMIAFPMLHRIGPNQNAYEVGIAPVDSSSPARALGPEVMLPASGSDEAFVAIEFSPDGESLIVGYPDSPTSTTNAIWQLPVDGTPGRLIGEGTFAELDIQRQAP